MRLFVAIPVEGQVREALAKTQADMRALGRGNFPLPEDLHVTLAFLGEVSQAEDVISALEGVQIPSSVPLALAGLGRFGDLWWAGVQADPSLSALAGQVRHRLQTAGFSLEPRPWLAHITLVRRWQGKTPPPAPAAAVQMVTGISLLETIPPPRVGPAYRVIWQWGGKP